MILSIQVNDALCPVVNPLSLFLLLDVLSKFSLKLSKYSVVNPQLTNRWKRNLNTNSEVGVESNLAILSHIF